MKAFARSSILAVALLTGFPLVVANPIRTRPIRTATQIEIQNDTIAGTDHYYSSGVAITRINWIQGNRPTLPQRHDHYPTLPPTFGALTQHKTETVRFKAVTVGQKIYTPTDLSQTNYQPHDRPYAGWTYLRISSEAASFRQRNRFALEVGTFGPDSFAADLQQAFHDAIGSTQPQGWEHQIQNETAVDLRVERETRLYSYRLFGERRLDLSHSETATLGTAHTNASFGLKASVARGPSRLPTPSLRVFTHAQITWVGRDRSLSGPLLADTSRVRTLSHFGEIELGFEYKTAHASLNLSISRRSKQFDTQRSDHTFGTLRLTLW